MALNYVTLTVDLYDGQGNALTQGTASFVPSATLTDTADQEIITQAPIVVSFHAGAGPPTVSLLATDNASPGQMSWNTTTFGYPNTSTNPESDWVDVEVAPVAPSGSGLLMASFP